MSPSTGGPQSWTGFSPIEMAGHSHLHRHHPQPRCTALTFLLGHYPQDWITSGFAHLHDFAAAHMPAGEFSSLLVDGIIPGVGAVVVFVPLIMILMGCISFLEDTGYLSRLPSCH